MLGASVQSYNINVYLFDPSCNMHKVLRVQDSESVVNLGHGLGGSRDYQLRRTSRLTNDFPNSLFVSRIRIMVVIASTHQGCADTSGLPYLRRVHVRARRSRRGAGESRETWRPRGTRREFTSRVYMGFFSCRERRHKELRRLRIILHLNETRLIATWFFDLQTLIASSRYLTMAKKMIER